MEGASEKTLAIIKPDAFDNAKEIEDIILKEGYTITHKKKLHLTRDQASEFYAEHYGKPFYSALVTHMSSGPILVLCLSRTNVIEHWREVLGPTKSVDAKASHPDSIRAKFAHPTRDICNAAHGSDSAKSAEKELQYFFPEMTLEPMLTADAAADYLAQNVNPTLTKGLVELCREKPIDPVTWLADWLMKHNPNKPCIGKELPASVESILDFPAEPLAPIPTMSYNKLLDGTSFPELPPPSPKPPMVLPQSLSEASAALRIVASSLKEAQNSIQKATEKVSEMPSTVHTVSKSLVDASSSLREVYETLQEVTSTVLEMSSSVNRVSSTLPNIPTPVLKASNSLQLASSSLQRILSTVHRSANTIQGISQKASRKELKSKISSESQTTLPRVSATLAKVAGTLQMLSTSVQEVSDSIHKVSGSVPDVLNIARKVSLTSPDISGSLQKVASIFQELSGTSLEKSSSHKTPGSSPSIQKSVRRVSSIAEEAPTQSEAQNSSSSVRSKK